MLNHKNHLTFRGKLHLNHEWRYGDYYNNKDVGVNQDIIVEANEDTGAGDHYPVKNRYVGLWTRENDIFGCPIYEDDILQTDFGKIVISREKLTFYISEPGRFFKAHFNPDKIFKNNWHVIGNIHDDAELLKSNSDD